jgi:hypothetical protein
MATHLGQSNYVANQQQVLGFAVPFTSLSKLCQIAGLKPFFWTKPSCFDFSSSNFNLQGHIMCTGGVALRGGWVLRTKCPPTSYNQLCEIHFWTLNKIHFWYIGRCFRGGWQQQQQEKRKMFAVSEEYDIPSCWPNCTGPTLPNNLFRV